MKQSPNKQGFLAAIRGKKWVQTLAWLLLIAAIWQAVTALGLVSSYFLPKLSDVLATLAHEVVGGSMGMQILNSLKVVFIGLAVSFAIVAAMVLLSIASKAANSFFQSISTLLNTLPSMALMPLIIMWFGINLTAMVVLIIHGVVWNMCKQLLEAIKALPKSYLEFAGNIELTKLQTTFGIVCYAVFPELISSMRIAWGQAWRSLIAAEIAFGMIGALGGLGYFISLNRAYGRMDKVMAGVIVIAVLGILVETLFFSLLERKTIKRWGMVIE